MKTLLIILSVLLAVGMIFCVSMMVVDAQERSDPLIREQDEYRLAQSESVSQSELPPFMYRVHLYKWEFEAVRTDSLDNEGNRVWYEERLQTIGVGTITMLPGASMTVEFPFIYFTLPVHYKIGDVLKFSTLDGARKREGEWDVPIWSIKQKGE